MNAYTEALAAVLARLRTAEAQFDRSPSGVRLLAVSKHQPSQAIRALHALGQVAFGENQVQEARRKQAELADLALEWHFIGALQRNKTQAVAAHFSWVQSLDRADIAQRLHAQRPPELPPLQVCLQVNLDHEAQKHGCLPEGIAPLAATVAGLSRLQLRGLMAIPAQREDFTTQRSAFARLHHLYQQIQAQGYALDTLSMGMSADLEAAIAEGATLVRIGTALFGARTG